MTRDRRLGFALAVAVMCAALSLVMFSRSGADATSAPAAAGASDASSIVVRAHRAEDMDAIARHATALGYEVRRRDEGLKALALAAPTGIDAAQAVGAFALLPGVLYAEPAYSMASADAPTDTLYPRQTYLAKVHAPEAWDVETGQPGVIVAVLDSGVDLTHPDLAGRIWTNPGETAGNNRDDDGNGCVDDAHGCAFVTFAQSGCDDARDGQVADDGGHGTFVAGIIAANADGRGIVGVARGVTIMPVKVLDCGGGGNSLDVAIGILYAAKNGARVINISLVGRGDSAFLREAVRIAHDEHDALVVAASGNSGRDGVLYPAHYDQVVAVGAADETGQSRASFSTSGPEVDVVAVGEDIIGPVLAESCRVFLPCIGSSPYAIASGTSFSAPQVAGLAALILSRRPATSADGVALVIKQTADPIAGGANWSGAGRINMRNALAPQYRLGAPGVARD